MTIEKTIVALIAAKNMTEKNVARSCEFAQYVLELMEENGIKSVLNGRYVLRESVGNGWSDTNLYFDTQEQFQVILTINNINADNGIGYLYGDYNSHYNLPNRQNILNFANDALPILEEIKTLISKEIKFPCFEKGAN